jgi:hypothetical protein
MDENEIKAVSEALEQLRQGGQISADTLNKLGGTTQNANKALAGYTQKLLGATGSIAGMGKAVAEGEGSFKSLGSSITGLTGLIGNLASAIPLVGGAAKALADGVGQAAKFVLDQLDTMAKNYQTLGDASAGAADGVDGLLRQFNQLGNYSLPAFARAVKNNTVGLAAFQGTASAGAEELSKVAGVLTTGNTAQRFLKLGMSLDAVGDATTSYLTDNARYGLTQGKTTEELTKKTQNYIEEVDKIARLTGQTREAQQKEAQKSLIDARFRAKIADMAANGQTEQAEELRKYVEGLGGAAGDAARALVTGIPLTKEAASANLFSNDAIRQNTLSIQNNGKKATTAIADTQQALADGSVRFGKQIMYAGDAFGGVAVQAFDYAAILKEQSKAENAGLTREQVIEKMQKKQMTASGQNTEAFTKAQLATANASKNLQSLGFSLAEAAIPAVETFAKTLDEATEWMAKRFGIAGTTRYKPGVNHGTPGGPGAAASAAGGSTTGTPSTGVVPGSSVTIGNEKRSGGDRNWRNNNPGNIEYGPFAKSMGAVGTDGRFAIFPSMEMGRKAADTLLKGKSYADLSARQALKKWAPESENNIQAYANSMAAQGVDLNKRYSDMTPAEQAKFLDAMTKVEGGRAGTITGADPNAPSIAGPTEGTTPRATTVSGPSSTNTATTVTKIDPVTSTSAGNGTSAQAKTANKESQDLSHTSKLTKQLSEFNQTQRELLSVNKKILARQSG